MHSYLNSYDTVALKYDVSHVYNAIEFPFKIQQEKYSTDLVLLAMFDKYKP